MELKAVKVYHLKWKTLFIEEMVSKLRRTDSLLGAKAQLADLVYLPPSGTLPEFKILQEKEKQQLPGK